MANRRAFYDAWGPIRLECGHQHEQPRSAIECVTLDQAAQLALGSSSDRVVCVVDRGIRTPLFAAED